MRNTSGQIMVSKVIIISVLILRKLRAEIIVQSKMWLLLHPKKYILLNHIQLIPNNQTIKTLF